MSNSIDNTLSSSDMAIALRQRSLRFWLHASTHPSQVTIHIPESRPVRGTFIAVDAQEHRVRINTLETPIGTYSHVVLRGTDIDAIELPLSQADGG
ncbi:hypothetical protein BGZ94_007829 [Podila epigama]|nr:hypothetical protein BGZ94_007829 [Podila epigama]